ncbi:DHA1 family bicyclomycin/chloramphenicol resistance-like MFS transporter [Palleronia aestuarii]|uniref:Bcr/CflA family efflux transporter n=1 Tax=Palleronia aestuarii TaxID=568105 RepID=A0A2W7NBE0_9RHOB|nr:multidrug effflux MFS transporter [Palleronia aestuarii]PZX17651.1 DHA1 family bicyclomycin/chloramphenicol resistance-like MFS transporter [Palleronia aestuarii]
MAFLSAARDPAAAPHVSYAEFVAMIALLMALNAAAIDVYIPALSDIGSALGVTGSNRMQFVITTYVIGFGGAQILYGPLSDRFGRRKILFAGLGIYLAGAVAAVFAPNFETLLALRFVQGVGAAATRVVATSVVRDRFHGPRMASVMSLVMMVFMVMPVFAPNIGSLVLAFGSWRELSGFMVLFGLVALVWAWARLPETLAPENRRPLTGRRVAEAFRIVLTNRIAFGYTLAMASFFGVLFAFIAQAEQIYTGIYGLGSSFTLYFSLVALFMSASSFANSRLVGRIGTRRLSHMALVGFITISAVHLACALYFGGATPFWLFLTLLICMMCFFGFVPTNFNALAMEPLGHVAGVASSVLGCAQTLGGGLLGGLVGYFYDGTLIPILSGFLGLASLSLILVAIAEKGRLFAAPEEEDEPDYVPAE